MVPSDRKNLVRSVILSDELPERAKVARVTRTLLLSAKTALDEFAIERAPPEITICDLFDENSEFAATERLGKRIEASWNLSDEFAN